MKIYILDDEFYNKKFKKILKLKEYEVIKNNNGYRPYYYSFNMNNKIILLPLRSNSSKISRSNKFSTKKVDELRIDPAIDFTSLLVINRDEKNFLKEITLRKKYQSLLIKMKNIYKKI